MARFSYPQLSAIGLLKAAAYFNAKATEFDPETQVAITHCCGIFGIGADPSSFLAEGDFVACLQKLVRLKATGITYSMRYNQFSYAINGVPGFRVLKGDKFTPNAACSLVPEALANAFYQGMEESSSTIGAAGSSTLESAFFDSACASANSSAPASPPTPPKRSRLSPTAAEFRGAPPARSGALTASPSPTTTTKKVYGPVYVPERRRKVVPTVQVSDRARLLKELGNVQLKHFTEYREDPDFYGHMCSTLFPGEAPDHTTDTPTLLAKWRRELGI